MQKINKSKTIALILLSVSTLTAQELTKKNIDASAQEIAKAIQPPVVAPLNSTVYQVEESKVVITMPSVPKAPKLILLDCDGKMIKQDSMDSIYKKEEHVFSNRVAPSRFNKNVEHKDEEILVGDIVDSRVTAYLHSPLITVDEVKANLKKAGFEVLSTFKVDKKGKVVSIVYTNNAMKKAASKYMRGFAGTLRIVVDTKNKLTVITNPIYMMRAFMQKEYDEELAVSTLKSLRDAFEDVKNSHEMIKFRTLERYRFIENMPYYQDMKLIAEGKNEDLLKKVQKSKQVIYTQHLDNGSVVVGVQLGKRTSKFVKKIGYQNSGLLPYPVLIENGKAKILAPQYYIAVMYPMLKMSQFMKIATVPGAITKDIDKVFR